jgi:hypothetical protein
MMAEACKDIEPRERYVAVTFPEYVWEFLENESEESGTPISTIVSRIVSGYVRKEKKNCG